MIIYRLKAPKGNKIKIKLIDPESILEPIKSKSLGNFRGDGNFLKGFQTFTKLIQIRIVAFSLRKEPISCSSCKLS
jgi:hypothetical protein